MENCQERREELDLDSTESYNQPDSYLDSDFERWGELRCQTELSSSLTAGVDDTGLPVLPSIVDVEMSRELRFMY